MNAAIARARRRQSGFTLIELLVVIVILGLLSAVVVFAVRGVGDKGKANAVATDERTIRTAEEAYCAKAGQYANMDQLTGNAPAADGNTYKFLSEASTYHAVIPGTDIGNCNGQKYSLTTGPTTTTSTSNPAAEPVCPQPDSFCDVDAGVLRGRAQIMVSLPNGKVLAFQCIPSTAGNNGRCDTPVDEYDANVGQYGTWRRKAPSPPISPVDQFSATTHYVDYAALIKRGPGPNGDCAPNCNKVLVHFWTASWRIFDPNADPPTWTDVTQTSEDPGFNQSGVGSLSGAAQILGAAGDTSGDSCGSYCGKFLMTYVHGNVPYVGGAPIAELFDPKTATFSPVGFLSPAGTDGEAQWTAVAPLKDGRILIAARENGLTPGTHPEGLPQWTRFFNPRSTDPTTVFQNGDFPPTLPHYHWGSIVDWTVLSNGDVLWVTAGDAEVFGADGVWRKVDSCMTPGSADTDCKILTAMGGNSALAVSTVKDNAGQESVTGTWRFDPGPGTGTGKWIKTKGNPTKANGFNAAALIGGDSCTSSLCGKVIAAGAKNIQPGTAKASQLYSPPTG